MEPVVITIREILNQANTLCDDNINHNVLIMYFNKGVTSINAYANLKLPLISYDTVSLDSNAADTYDVCTAAFTNNQVAFILTNFVAKTIREVDGYSVEANEFNAEYSSLLVSFNSKYSSTVKPEYQLEPGDGGNIYKAPLSPRAYWLKRNRLY